MPETRDRNRILQEALVHWKDAFGLAFVLTRDRGRSEDLCQEAMLRIATMKREPDRSRSLRPLLLRIVRNQVVSDGRRRGAASLEELSEGGGELADPGASDPRREAQRREELDAVRAALARLAPSWRSILYLRDGLGLSYREIAEIENRSEDVIRVTLHRARKRVRAELMGLMTRGNER